MFYEILYLTVKSILRVMFLFETLRFSIGTLHLAFLHVMLRSA